MATGTQSRNQNLQNGIRGGSSANLSGNDGTVFRSSGEFWFWLVVVTLILFCLMILALVVIHLQRQSNRTEGQLQKATAILNRLEEKEKKKSYRTIIGGIIVAAVGALIGWFTRK